jgi:hypothetical protein
MSEMPIPQWAKDAKDQMVEAHAAIDYSKGGLDVRDLNKVLDFSTLFAEYEEKSDTLLVHFFPRSGEGDRYYPAEVKEDGTRVPGRLELCFREIKFPEDMEDRIKKAADKVWLGDIAIERIKVLRYEDDDDVSQSAPREVDVGSYVVQFQDVKNTVHLIGVGKFVDQFCEELDNLLEG